MNDQYLATAQSQAVVPIRHDSVDVPMVLDASGHRFADPDSEGIQKVRDSLISAGFCDVTPTDYEYSAVVAFKGYTIDVSLTKDTSRVAYVTSAPGPIMKAKVNLLSDTMGSKRAIQVLVGENANPMYVPLDGVGDEERTDYILCSVLAAVTDVARREMVLPSAVVRQLSNSTLPSTASEEM